MRRVARPALAAAIVIALLAIFRNSIAAGIIADAAGLATGTRVSFRDMRLGTSGAAFTDLEIRSKRDEPILRVAHVAIAYDLRDLLPGGRRKYGLRAISLDGVRLTIVRRSDGTFNIPFPKPSKGKGGGPPFIFHASLRNGSAAFIDERGAEQRTIDVGAIEASLDLDTAARSTYRLSASYLDDRRAFPIYAQGTIDEAHPFTLQHLWARSIPIADIANAIAGSATIAFISGDLDDFDVRVFGFAAPGSPLHAHIVGGVELRNASVAVAALSAPISNVHGRFDITESAVETTGLYGHLGAIRATLAGGVFDLEQPHADVTLLARADLDQVRGLVRAARSLPSVNGPVTLRVAIEGPALHPLALASVSSPSLVYHGVALTATRTLVAAAPDEIDILDAQTHDGAIALAATGTVAPSRTDGALRLLLTGTAPANSLPFVGGVLPGMDLYAGTLATASTLHRVQLAGFIGGRTAARSASAIFAVNSRGVGAAGPVLIQDGPRTLYARIAIDHPHRQIAVLARAQSFSLTTSAPVGLGDFRVPVIPIPPGVVSGAALGTQDAGTVAMRIQGGAFTSARYPPVSNLEATVAMRNGSVDVYSASGRVASGMAQAVGAMGAGGRGVALVVRGARLRNLPISGATSLHLKNGTLRVSDAFARAGPAIVNASGDVAMRAEHSIALDADITGLDLSTATAIADPALADDVTGSADARLRVVGSAAAPSIDAVVDAPEGSVYGEGFRELRLSLSGRRSAIALRSASVVLGESRLSISGSVSHAGSRVTIAAPRIDLADLDDFFDAGDTLAGEGRLYLTLASGGGVRTSGNAYFTRARFRRYDLGTAQARWSTAGSLVRLVATTHSETGDLRVAGSVGGSMRAPLLDLRVGARNVALGSWLPPISLKAPVLGTANAEATIRGRYPSLTVAASAGASHVMIGRVPIASLHLLAGMRGDEVALHSLQLAMPYLAARATGSFSLRNDASLDLQAQAQSADVGGLAQTITGKKSPFAGSFAAQVAMTGTRRDPHATATIAVRALRYRSFAVPAANVRLAATKTSIALRSGEADFASGRLLAQGEIPLRGRGFSLSDAPLQVRVRSDALALSNFAPLLGEGTKLGGRIDGDVSVSGKAGAPRLSGTAQLTGGSYSGPFDSAPLDDVALRIALAGRTIELQSLDANAGGGKLGGSGRIVLGSLRDPAGAAYSFLLTATHASIASSKYFTGIIDARVSASRAAAKPLTIGGTVTVSHARIPLSALYHPSSPSTASPPNVAFDTFGIVVGPDVRVQNSTVDVGAAGSATLSGTLAAPVMAGTFRATGGTVNFYQLFQVRRAVVAFDPAQGIAPTIDAVAATSIANPPTDIRIHVTGPVTNMSLALSSDPSYSRTQILGLLVGMQSFGAVQGVPGSTASPFSASSAVQRVGFGEANRIFTRSILDPVSTTLGGALGTSNLALYSNIGSGYGTGIGAQIEKRIAQHVTVATSATVGYPRQEMVKLRYLQRNGADVSLRVFQQQESFMNAQPPGLAQGPGGLNLQPSDAMLGGARSGVFLSFERRYFSCGVWHYCLSCARC